MEYQLDIKDGGLRRLSFVCPAGEVLSEWKKAAAFFASSFRMAGFRPGKAPLEVVEKQFLQQISDGVTDTLVSRSVGEALKKESLVPAAGLDYEGGNAARGQDFHFSVEFCVLEERDLPDIEAIHIKEEEPQADPVQESLFVREILGRAAERTAVTEGHPQDGDIVQAEVTGKMDGRVVPGMNTGSCRMRLMPARPGERVPDLDPIVRGLTVGETGSGSTPCPDEWNAFSAGHGGSAASMPDMGKMMQSMRGAGDGGMTAPGGGMPLVMPPVQKNEGAASAPSAAPAMPGMPLITPPAEGK